MRRMAAGLVFLGLGAGLWEARATEDPPPLAPPVVTPPLREAPSDLPPVIEARPSQDRGAVLVVPGITTPRPGATNRRPVAPGRANTPAGVSSDGLPPIVGPAEMLGPTQAPPFSPASVPGRITAPRGNAGGELPPLILES